ncbi:MAG: DUF1178 family protein [Hellea sp.]|nr:DUF1178 family protein [Hellea sp.]
MIKYALICQEDHSFDGWFSSIKDYDYQAQKGLIECPFCGTQKVEKAVMAPNISTGRKKDAMAAQQAQSLRMMNAAADKIRKEIAENCDYVGEKFPDEARAIHYGEKPERAIYGEATPKQASSLNEEGVTIAPLPDILAPKPKSKQN